MITERTVKLRVQRYDVFLSWWRLSATFPSTHILQKNITSRTLEQQIIYIHIQQQIQAEMFTRLFTASN